MNDVHLKALISNILEALEQHRQDTLQTIIGDAPLPQEDYIYRLGAVNALFNAKLIVQTEVTSLNKKIQ